MRIRVCVLGCGLKFIQLHIYKEHIYHLNWIQTFIKYQSWQTTVMGAVRDSKHPLSPPCGRKGSQSRRKQKTFYISSYDTPRRCHHHEKENMRFREANKILISCLVKAPSVQVQQTDSTLKGFQIRKKKKIILQQNGINRKCEKHKV